MVKVEFHTAEGEVVATMAVAASGLEKIEDPQSVVDFTVNVIGVHTGKAVAFDDDSEEWARSLPRAYRNPYLFAVVVDDDNPVSPVDQKPMEIEERHLVGA